MTYLFQPLDLTTNVAFTNHDKRSFNEYFSSRVIAALKKDPDCDVIAMERTEDRKDIKRYMELQKEL